MARHYEMYFPNGRGKAPFQIRLIPGKVVAECLTMDSCRAALRLIDPDGYRVMREWENETGRAATDP